jgi:ABC-type phosphate transport system substrate-binding protein
MAMIRAPQNFLPRLGSRRSFAIGFVLALLLILGLASPVVSAEQEAPPFRVIVHPNNPINSASEDLLTDIFLKRRKEWQDGEAARPVDQKRDSETRKKFSSSVLHRSVAAVKSYWQQLIFAGRELPPPELESDEAVVQYVVNNRGAVGYVSGSCALGRAKAINVN